MALIPVRNGDVSLPVTLAGDGPTAVFVNGMSITVDALEELTDALRSFLTLATFDLRGHGGSGPSEDYSYAGFAGDAAAVVDAVSQDGPVILLGFSLGADLALDQAAARPDTPALFLLDGATPLDAPFLDEGELAGMHAMIAGDPPERYALTADDHVAALRDIDAHRRTSTERFAAVRCPVTMVMSETIAGTDDDRARELNAQWSRGVDELVADRPDIELHRLPGGHDLPLVHPQEVARIVRERVSQL